MPKRVISSIGPMRSRLAYALGLLLVAISLGLAGCGGGGDGGGKDSDGGSAATGETPAGAALAPSTAVGFVFADTDFDGDGWQALDDLSRKFPDREELLARIQKELADEGISFEDDIKPALGPETDIGLLGFEGEGMAVGLTKPGDDAKARALFEKLLDEGDTAAYRTVDGWLAASDQQSVVDAVPADDTASLTKNDLFTAAMSDLPGGALLKLWLDGATLTKQVEQGTQPDVAKGLGTLLSVAASLDASDDGARMHVVARRQGGVEATIYSSELVSQAPAGALVYLSFKGLDAALKQVRQNPAVAPRIAEVEAQLGVTLDELGALFAGEGAFYLRQGSPIPEVTLLLQAEDENASLATADRLLAKLGPSLGLAGPPTSTEVDGVAVKKLTGEQFAIYYGAVDGKLVFTSSTTGITGLKEGDKLDSDDTFSKAREAVDMPDETAGFLYANLKQLVPLVLNFSTTAGRTVPPDVEGNLEPLRSLLFYGAADGDKVSLTGFLGLE